MLKWAVRLSEDEWLPKASLLISRKTFNRQRKKEKIHHDRNRRLLPYSNSTWDQTCLIIMIVQTNQSWTNTWGITRKRMIDYRLYKILRRTQPIFQIIIVNKLWLKKVKRIQAYLRHQITYQAIILSPLIIINQIPMLLLFAALLRQLKISKENHLRELMRKLQNMYNNLDLLLSKGWIRIFIKNNNTVRFILLITTIL